MRKKALLPIMVALAAIVLLGCKNPVTSSTDTVINLAAIAGVTAPATGASPVTAITETAQYTGTVAWNDSPTTFAASTVYTATITLTAKAGYTLTGVAENFFTVTGATATNPENSGVITAVFSKTTFLAKNYINTTPGFGIRYHITDNYESYAFDSYAWAVSQNLTTNLPNELDFVITLNEENNCNLSNSLGGKCNLILNEEKYLGLYAGFPSMNQGNFYLNLMLPVYFDKDMSWTVNTRTFFVAELEDITIGANTFTNCQRINITDTDSSEYLNGSGYVLYAKDIGIIKIYFKRTDGSEVIFTYDSHFQFIENTITGTVFSSGDIPANGKIIQISNGNWGNRSITNSDGQYSISAFGPDIVLRIGDDIDNNNILDFTPDLPKEFWLNNITSSINNINIILSDL